MTPTLTVIPDADTVKHAESYADGADADADEARRAVRRSATPTAGLQTITNFSPTGGATTGTSRRRRQREPAPAREASPGMV